MDNTQTVTHISLCAGYGGIDLGLRGAIPSLRTVAFSEIEGFACANLVSKMEEGLLDCAPIWTDLKTFPWGAFSDRVDILSGGYPCQPFSAAGKRLGTDDPRHLWPFIADGIRILRPKLCFFENVEGHISLGLREVIGELESMGYSVSWGIFSAREVGAPHQRKRVFIMAHRKCTGLEGWRSAMQSTADRCWPSDNTRKSGDLLANTDSIGNTRSRHELGMPSETRQGGEDIAPNRFVSTLWPSRPGQPQYGWEPPRVVGDTQGQRPAALRPEHERLGGQLCASGSGREGVVGDAEGGMPRQSSGGDWRESVGGAGEGGELGNSAGRLQHQTNAPGKTGWRSTNSEIPNSNWDGQIESPLGRNFNESTRGMDYAELSVSCDNRTDELRLLGNGVVPATATLAFQTLLAELLNL